MKKIKVTQIKSKINCTQRQKRVLESLGLKKINHFVIHDNSSTINGMVNKVKHLISTEEISK